MSQGDAQSTGLDERVALITGAGMGLGRSHALELAKRGAKVLVNDRDLDAAQTVAEEINTRGGCAMAYAANVSDAVEVQTMVAQLLRRWGRIDILVNNAGILRDKSFSKMTIDDFRLVLDVHLLGAFNCCKAVWDSMKTAQYGRIVMTTSSSGLYGNFGQANYGAAKMALIGLMNVLHLEGLKYDIRVNALSPMAATRMTQGIVAEAELAMMSPASVSAGLAYLVGENAPSRLILCAGAGSYAAAKIYETEGVYLLPEQQTLEGVAANIAAITDSEGQHQYIQGFDQGKKFCHQAARHLGVDL